MKKYDPDLTILDHADESALAMLSEIPLAGESEKKKILEASIRKYEQRIGALSGADGTDSVEGVESYRRPKWHITVSSIAAVLSLGVGFAAISHILRSPSPAPPQDPLVATEATNASEAEVTAVTAVPGTGTLPVATRSSADTETTAAQESTGSADTEASTVPVSDTETTTAAAAATAVTPAPGLHAVEIHSDNYPSYTEDELVAKIKAANADYAANGPRLIDRSIYIDMINNAADSAALNTPEIKSYIYHMMLNSTDYFNTADGTIVYSLTNSSGESFIQNSTSFKTDISGQTSKYLFNGMEGLSAVFTSGNTQYIFSQNGTTGYSNISVQEFGSGVTMADFRYHNTDPGLREVHNISTNDRYVSIPDASVNGQRMTHTRICNNYVTYTGMGASCLEPSTEAIDYLCHFAEWQITGKTNIAGRECVVLQPTSEYAAGPGWTFCVDIEYGFLMKMSEPFSSYDSGETSTYEVTLLSIDGSYFGGGKQEYGLAEGAPSFALLPDYILVAKDPCITGYIRRDDLLAVTPLTRQASDRYTGFPVNLNMYDKETGEVIGTFTVNDI